MNRRDFLLASTTIGLLTQLPFSQAFAAIRSLYANTPIDGLFSRDLVASLDQVRQGILTREQFLKQIIARYQEFDQGPCVSDFIDSELKEVGIKKVFKKKILWPSYDQKVKVKLQLFFLAPNTAHPPHAHHNLISVQNIIRGKVFFREYQRLQKIGNDHVQVVKTREGSSTNGPTMWTTEHANNVHWFCTLDQPSIILNMNVQGTYQASERFDVEIKAPSGRDYLELFDTSMNSPSVVRRIDHEEAHGRFSSARDFFFD